MSIKDNALAFDSLSPIAIFAYKRLDTLKKVIENLQQCFLADKSELFVFSDGAKINEDQEAVNAVRAYLEKIKGFKKIHLKFSEKNKGLADSIITGASEILDQYHKIIVLEDDLIPSTNFLEYMNQALHTYKDNANVFSISGYTSPIKKPRDYSYDNYFTLRGSSWGWGTWTDRWEKVDWQVKDYKEFAKDNKQKRKFNQMGSDLSGMLSQQMKGEISSWAIRWCYHQFKIKSYTAFPIISKISNVGFGDEATHTAGADERFKTPLDVSSKKNFMFHPTPHLNPTFIKQFVSRYSLKTRAYYKIKIFFSR